MKKPLSSLALRLISSVVLIPIVVGIIILGGWYFATLAALCIGIAVAEWINISQHIPLSNRYKILLIVIGVIYLEGSFGEMVYMRQQDDGVYWTVVFMLVIWASDSVAFLFGKTMGGPKMTPTISPNKTWSGYVGALFGPAVVLAICVYTIPTYGVTSHPVSYFDTLIAGALVGVTGQAGDLMISAMKRRAGLKDTGALIPGHGGILDRIDALLLALPVYLAYVKYVTE
jgi:phosphatidate cytidylyltransferase